MTVFISGGAKNGKSSLAQELALRLAGEGKRCYVATMISTGEEDDERIRLHVADRAGLGFETVECGKNIMSIAEADSTFLVDSVTALMQNALFPIEKNYEMDLRAAKRCADELIEFAGAVRHAVFVSDYIFSDVGNYSESTQEYRRQLAALDRRLAQVCDVVIEAAAGCFTVHKGELSI